MMPEQESTKTVDPAPSARLARRRRLLLWSVLPVVLALLLAAKLLSVPLFSAQAAAAFESRDAASLARASDGLRVANFLETHKPAFAKGDAFVLAGDFAGARLWFEDALDSGPGVDECRVRVNLGLSIERLGDAVAAADDAAGAVELFGQALEVVGGGPEACFAADGAATPGFNDAGEGEQLTAAAERLKEKLADAGNQAGADPVAEPGLEPEEEPEPADPAQQGQLERLKEMAGRALQDRTESEDRQEYLEDSGPSVDKPW